MQLLLCTAALQAGAALEQATYKTRPSRKAEAMLWQQGYKTVAGRTRNHPTTCKHCLQCMADVHELGHATMHWLGSHHLVELHCMYVRVMML